MSTGSLLYPIGFVFVDDSNIPVNAGKLYSYRTGTSTPQSLYSDSTLSTAISNPIILNASGRPTSDGNTVVPVYGASDTGFNYRLKLATSADAQIWQHDDVVVDGANTATLAEGSFTGTLTGYATPPTGTVTYKIVANSSGTGKICHLRIATAINGTSNTTAMTMTGLPAACSPTASVTIPCALVDNSGDQLGFLQISASGTTITFFTDLPFSSTGFTNSGTKGLHAGWSISYQL
jgi:hypothetical protein